MKPKLLEWNCSMVHIMEDSLPCSRSESMETEIANTHMAEEEMELFINNQLKLIFWDSHNNRYAYDKLNEVDFHRDKNTNALIMGETQRILWKLSGLPEMSVFLKSEKKRTWKKTIKFFGKNP